MNSKRTYICIYCRYTKRSETRAFRVADFHSCPSCHADLSMIRVIGAKVPVQSASKRVWHEFWESSHMTKTRMLRDTYIKKRNSRELLTYDNVHAVTKADERILRTDMTSPFEFLISLKTGFKVKHGTNLHELRAQSPKELEERVALISYCYCDQCRKKITETTLSEGKTPAYLHGWMKSV